MTKRLAVGALLLTLVAPQAFADFSHVARALERRLGTNRTWIPFLGVARALVRTVHPNGVHDVQLAVFEGHQKSLSGRATPVLKVRSSSRPPPGGSAMALRR